MRPKQDWSAEEIERHFKVMQQEIAASKNIVVMGGGPTGIEFVGVSARKNRWTHLIC
jgi:NADH dehydrogenase FAD-containing subunit